MADHVVNPRRYGRTRASQRTAEQGSSSFLPANTAFLAEHGRLSRTPPSHVEQGEVENADAYEQADEAMEPVEPVEPVEEAVGRPEAVTMAEYLDELDTEVDTEATGSEDALASAFRDADSNEPVDENETDHEESVRPEAVLGPATVGLKEISHLAHFGVSSHKPGNGVTELLSDDLDSFWQSDGQQPHVLTMHFVRRMEMRAIRFYVDCSQDESYTPIRVVFLGGSGMHDLLEFADMHLVDPVGWQDVPLANSGGGADGHSLCCHVVQMHIKENHQNGKDTHIRGIKIFSLDDRERPGKLAAAPEPVRQREGEREGNNRHGHKDVSDAVMQDLMEALNLVQSDAFSNGGVSDWMRTPVIR